ncbi:hypothetical protein ACVWZ4_000716 [Bradyrhizobium sp. USDA 4472]
MLLIRLMCQKFPLRGAVIQKLGALTIDCRLRSRGEDFRFGINKKGMVVLAGLSPEETFEFEELLCQDGCSIRMRELMAKHRGANEELTSEGCGCPSRTRE